MQHKAHSFFRCTTKNMASRSHDGALADQEENPPQLEAVPEQAETQPVERIDWDLQEEEVEELLEIVREMRLCKVFEPPAQLGQRQESTLLQEIQKSDQGCSKPRLLLVVHHG